jgi:hypothetical protein
MQLTSLQLLHGSLQPGLALAHWSSLKQLQELKLLPAEQAGLGDAQVSWTAGHEAASPHADCTTYSNWQFIHTSGNSLGCLAML